MRKVSLRMNELNKYDIIKKLVDSNGNKKNAAIKLDCTARTINRLIIKYKLGGKNDFVHKNRNRKPAIIIPIEIKNKVIELNSGKYYGANLLHFSQLLKKKWRNKCQWYDHQSLTTWDRYTFIKS